MPSHNKHIACDRGMYGNANYRTMERADDKPDRIFHKSGIDMILK